jgi:hypothetical protein
MQIRLAALTLVCAAAFAQEQTRTYTFAHTQNPQHMQETVNTIRSILEVKNVSLDPAQRSLTAGGTLDQLTLITWLFTDLDRPVSRPQTLQVRDSTFPDPQTRSVKIFYPAHLSTAQQVQEVVNAIRSIAEVQRCVALNGPGAIVVRGTSEQMALAEWLVGEFDRSLAGKRPEGKREYDFSDAAQPNGDRRSPAVRIYYPASVSTPLDMQEMVNGLRSIAEVQRAVAFTASGAIVIRASNEQAVLTDWLVQELDKGASAAGPSDYRFGGGTVRSAWLAKSADLPATVAKVRQSSGMQRVVALQRQRAIVMRGTPEQLAAADAVLR